MKKQNIGKKIVITLMVGTMVISTVPNMKYFQTRIEVEAATSTTPITTGAYIKLLESAAGKEGIIKEGEAKNKKAKINYLDAAVLAN